MDDSTRPSTPRGRAVREIVLFGIAGGLLLAVLKLTEYRFHDHPVTNAALTFATSFPVGLVGSLISAAILKRRR